MPNYDFNWQTDYVFATPLRVPKGSVLKSVAHYDNSKDNKSNPDATQDVYWGDQTWEEMQYTGSTTASTKKRGRPRRSRGKSRQGAPIGSALLPCLRQDQQRSEAPPVSNWRPWAAIRASRAVFACRACAVVIAAILALPEPVYSHKPITTNILFKNEIAQIFQRKCFQCHTENNLSMSLTTYTEARPWARAIREEDSRAEDAALAGGSRLRPFLERHRPEHAREGDHPLVGRRCTGT